MAYKNNERSELAISSGNTERRQTSLSERFSIRNYGNKGGTGGLKIGEEIIGTMGSS